MQHPQPRYRRLDFVTQARNSALLSAASELTTGCRPVIDSLGAEAASLPTTRTVCGRLASHSPKRFVCSGKVGSGGNLSGTA